MLIHENKKDVCEKLMKTLQATRYFEDLTGLEYSGVLPDGEEYVNALFRDGGRKTICVSGDSGIAMIEDIMKWLK